MLQSDTIAAIATYPSNSGIGIIRISGPDAISSCEQIFRSKVPLHEMSTHTISYGFLFDGEDFDHDEKETKDDSDTKHNPANEGIIAFGNTDEDTDDRGDEGNDGKNDEKGL